ncbi:unnamed protein product, partial [Phaeothamnion confervicola]
MLGITHGCQISQKNTPSVGSRLRRCCLSYHVSRTENGRPPATPSAACSTAFLRAFVTASPVSSASSSRTSKSTRPPRPALWPTTASGIPWRESTGSGSERRRRHRTARPGWT